MAVEIDGAVHDHESQWTHDKRRDGWFGENRIRVLRTPARDILNDEAIEGALASIPLAAAPSTAFGGPPPPRFARGRNLNTSEAIHIFPVLLWGTVPPILSFPVNLYGVAKFFLEHCPE